MVCMSHVENSPFRSVAAFGELTRECLSRLGFTFGGSLGKPSKNKKPSGIGPNF